MTTYGTHILKNNVETILFPSDQFLQVQQALQLFTHFVSPLACYPAPPNSYPTFHPVRFPTRVIITVTDKTTSPLPPAPCLIVSNQGKGAVLR